VLPSLDSSAKGLRPLETHISHAGVAGDAREAIAGCALWNSFLASRKRTLRVVLTCLAVVLLSCPAWADKTSDLELLRRCYPEAVKSVDPGGLTLTDGVKLAYHDNGPPKTPEETLDHPSLEDMLAQPYPLGAVTREPAPEFDPGRRRVAAFFKAVYGHDAGEVKANLTAVKFLSTTVSFNAKNGAAKALQAVGMDLEELLRAHPEYRARLLPISGTFAWRKVAATERLSMHSFGAAIDVNAKANTYWRWYKGADPLGLRTAFPARVVEIFERHGFIWGGKWARFDIMHFEYRPELIAKARKDAAPAP